MSAAALSAAALSAAVDAAAAAGAGAGAAVDAGAIMLIFGTKAVAVCDSDDVCGASALSTLSSVELLIKLLSYNLISYMLSIGIIFNSNEFSNKLILDIYLSRSAINVL